MLGKDQVFMEMNMELDAQMVEVIEEQHLEERAAIMHHLLQLSNTVELLKDHYHIESEITDDLSCMSKWKHGSVHGPSINIFAPSLGIAACGIAMPPTLLLPTRKRKSPFVDRSASDYSSSVSSKMQMKTNSIPIQSRLCGLIKPPIVAEDVAPFSVIQSISVQKLTPEYKVGMDPWALGELKASPPMRASELWTTKPTIFLCIRRPELVSIFLIAL
eukprot:Gb_20082 [translate_table: standard]